MSGIPLEKNWRLHSEYNGLAGRKRSDRKILHFKTLPAGTLTRKGELVALSFEGKTLVGIVLKILATFRNTGLIDIQAHFVGEVYKNGDLIDVIESSAILVEVGAEKEITSYFKLTKEDLYNIKGHVVYDGKQTDFKELLIEAKMERGPSETNQAKIERSPEVISLTVAGLLLIIIGIPTLSLYFIRKSRAREIVKPKEKAKSLRRALIYLHLLRIGAVVAFIWHFYWAFIYEVFVWNKPIWESIKST